MLRYSRYTSSCSGTTDTRAHTQVQQIHELILRYIADTRAHAQVQQIHELMLRYSRYMSSCSGIADIHELMLRYSRYTSSCSLSGIADTRAHAQV